MMSQRRRRWPSIRPALGIRPGVCREEGTWSPSLMESATDKTRQDKTRQDKTRQIYCVGPKRPCVIARDDPEDIHIHYCIKLHLIFIDILQQFLNILKHILYILHKYINL